MNFRQKLYNFMIGRYGFDALGKFLFSAGFATWIICFVLRIFCRFIPVVYYIYSAISAINTLVYVIAIFRILSRNCERRSAENIRFLNLRDKIKSLRDKGTGGNKSNRNDGYTEVKYRPVNDSRDDSYNKVKVTKPKKDKEHIFRKCPSCGTNLRLKKLKGKHNTVCPKCGTGFSVRVWF